MHRESNAREYLLGSDDTQVGTALFHQQMWCWGCDIRHPEGNLLLLYGFERERPPGTMHGSSAYHLHTPAGKGIGLWGFGLFYTQLGRGGLFLQRYGFVPRWSSLTTLPTQVWTLAQLPPTRLPRTPQEALSLYQLFTDLLMEISKYEQWIQATQGDAYRAHCMKDWPQPVCPANEMGAAWERLASTKRREMLSCEMIQEEKETER
jgi:hypothetical protein